VAFAALALAQFEPDPAALDVAVTLAATSSGDDPVPWVVFEDTDGELAAWALDELLQITPRRGVSRVPHGRPGEPEVQREARDTGRRTVGAASSPAGESCPGRSVDDRMARRAMAGWSGVVRMARERPLLAARERLARSATSFGESDGEGEERCAPPPLRLLWAGRRQFTAEARVYCTENVQAHNVVVLRSFALTMEMFFVPRFLV